MWLFYKATDHETMCGAPPTPHAYALILRLVEGAGTWSHCQEPVALLRNIVRWEIMPVLAILDRAFMLSEETTWAIYVLSKTVLHVISGMKSS